MKIKKYKKSNKNDKLIKLETLNLYSKSKQTNIQKILLQTHLIKICNIIYQYHLLNKKILFLGFPAHFKNILKETNHKIIQESLLFNGVISNTIKTKIKNIDLVIIHNQNNYSTIEKESYTARIPTITLNSKQKFTHNFFLIFLKNTLIKAKQSKTVIKRKATQYLSALLHCSKEDKLFYLLKLHEKHGLYIIYELIYILKKYNKYE